MFKYYRIPNTDILEKIIGDTPTIKFASAFDLNDPYELKFNLHIDPFAEGQLESFLKVHPGKTTADFAEWQEQVKGKEGYVWFTEQEQRNEVSMAITMTSFTENNSNNLMWSHYTDNHEGICVEYHPEIFDALNSHKEFIAEGKITYIDDPPLVDIQEDFGSRLNKMVFHKQSEWKYEKEHRIVLYSKQNADFVSIQASLIKAVYIGSRAPEAIVNKTIELCLKNNLGCFFGITLGKSYTVQFKPYKKDTFYSRTFWKPRPKETSHIPQTIANTE
ncbi:DUF2971 domain-containing protein [Sediminibacterium ginsengisoli]|uniref:DUF2971 domain-containing protein n=1 Tax=Sediminibacterium ginsengisoli TaxID=413434 RepID=A0A1T4P0F0_9BACT|nr:DUF2971 domain-containing protein [Sediminibacterium ginsengisoli]SJZ85080.1 Protein of unknown function [Sediminibacterium ginsengisoli]